MDDTDKRFIYRLSRQLVAKIYTGISMVFLVVYVSLALYCKFNENEQWTGIFLALGFGLFALFFLMAGREMKRAR